MKHIQMGGITKYITSILKYFERYEGLAMTQFGS
jgi:hypothetical protein